jgi:MOSC domain-containing protein YiiM
MKILSVNVGMPREIPHEGRLILTGIVKAPVTGRVRVNALNIEGDRQADLSVHGGASKAIYAYPAEHYRFWRAELPELQLGWGSFGENITTEGILENEIHVGDRLCAGTVELIVTEPRLPCYKLNAKFAREDMVKRFVRSRRTGFYLAVAREGEIGAGDSIDVLSRDEHRVSMAEITRLYAFDRRDLAAMRRAASVAALPESWRSFFLMRSRRTADSGARKDVL